MNRYYRKIMLLVSTFALLGVASAVPVVTITAPTSGATAGSPVSVNASATSTRAITLMQVYVDGVKKYEVSGSKVSTSISLSSGSHKLTVMAQDSSGTGKLAITFNASTSVPPLATYSNIDQMTGWVSCDACAGPSGNGPATPHTITQNLSSPSMDGKAAEVWVGGSTPYAAALWWRQLGAVDAAHKLTYDLYFYLKNPSASQALEFDANQTVGGHMYVFGSQCNIRGSKQWDIWDLNKHWMPTGIPCSAPSAYTWHHLTWEFERINGQMHYISLTYDGKKTYVNRYAVPRNKTTRELNVAVQLDGNSSMTDYSMWIDKVSLKIW